jgi:hypothetical protein
VGSQRHGMPALGAHASSNAAGSGQRAASSEQRPQALDSVWCTWDNAILELGAFAASVRAMPCQSTQQTTSTWQLSTSTGTDASTTTARCEFRPLALVIPRLRRPLLRLPCLCCVPECCRHHRLVRLHGTPHCSSPRPLCARSAQFRVSLCSTRRRTSQTQRCAGASSRPRPRAPSKSSARN